MTAPIEPSPTGSNGVLRRAGALAAVLIPLLLGGCAAGAPHPAAARATHPGSPDPVASTAAPALATAPRSTPTAGAHPATAATPGSALAVLAGLPVKGRAPMTGYARVADFGTAWLDVDRNGCDTRNDILRRDLVDPTGSGCRVLSGVLDDPYTGDPIDFVRGEGTSTAVQIDHVVALGDAWQTGAQRLSQAKRVDLANDPINLFAVDGPTNERKGDGDAATWLPPNKAFRCTYVAHQVGVKKAYGLWVTAAEKAAMQRILATCPTVRAPTSRVSGVVLSVAAPAGPAPASSNPNPNADAEAGRAPGGRSRAPRRLLRTGRSDGAHDEGHADDVPDVRDGQPRPLAVDLLRRGPSAVR